MSKALIVIVFVLVVLVTWQATRMFYAIANVTVDGKGCNNVLIDVFATHYKDCTREL